MKQTTIVDKVLLGLSSALVLLGVVVLGVVEILDGKPYGAAPVTNKAGEVVATPGVDPNIRTGLVLLGFVVLGVWCLYRAWTTPRTETSEETYSATVDQPAD